MDVIVLALILTIVVIILVYHLLIRPFRDSIEEIIKVIGKFADTIQLAVKRMEKNHVANIMIDIIIIVGGIYGALNVIPEDQIFMRFSIIIGIFVIVAMCLNWIMKDKKNV